MPDQSDRKPEDIKNILMDYSSPWDSIVLNTEAENFFIAGLGIVFNHYVAIPNVVGEVNDGDLRRSYGLEDQNQFEFEKQFDFVENGFLYKFVGQIWGIFQGNAKDMRQVQAGLYSQSGASVTFNRYYRGTNKYVGLAPYDKLVPCISGEEFFSVNFEKVHAGTTGRTRLQYRACAVEFVVDSQGRMYSEGKDFSVISGDIVWKQQPGADHPGFDPISGKTRLISVRYRYKPTFYVQHMGHDIRICPTFDAHGNIDTIVNISDSGEITYKPGPISASLVADWVYLDRRTAEEAPDQQIASEEDGENVGPF